MREELKAWSRFLAEFSGISFCREARMLRAVFQVQLGTAGPLGFGIHFGDRYGALSSGQRKGTILGVTRDQTVLEFFSSQLVHHGFGHVKGQLCGRSDGGLYN